jgi:hypothetical protein
MMSGLVGAGIGALGGAAFGTNGVNGFLGSWGPGVGIGLLVVGGAYSAATGNLDVFAGGLIGGIGGFVAGQGVLNSSALKNNPAVKSYKETLIKNNNSLKPDQKPRAIKVYKQGEMGPELEGALYDGEFYPAKTAKGGEKVFRVFGGKSQMKGDSWTPLDPRNLADAADILGLPGENSKGALIGGRLNPGARYVEIPASPVGSNRGGGIEYLLDNPARDVNTEIIRTWDFTNTYGN